MIEVGSVPGLTTEALERICDASWSGSGEGVKFRDIYTHNACNHTLSGEIDVDGVTYGFIIDNGDRAGTVVNAWGLADDVPTFEEPEPPEPRAFIPSDDDLFYRRPYMFDVYLAWRKDWIPKEERNYNYDRHFQPGTKTETHYKELAAKRGLKIGYLSELSKEVQEAIQRGAR